MAPAAAAQTASQNVNIVSGPVQVTKDPTTGTVTILGDPFLQRQNEPSIAVSTVNPLHLLAGTNDYRSVDIPFPDTLTGRLVGDAWCGWFFSPDGGQSWQSTLVPGYPQDNTPAGLASPLKNYNVCSDPTVRPGPAGMFYYSGIAFHRTTGQSVIWVARFIDRNDTERGNLAKNSSPIRYLDTTIVDTGTTGQFLDKTWNAVLLQPGSGTCTVNVPNPDGSTESVSVPSMSVYVVWSRFTGSTSSKIMVTRSAQCGQPGTYVTAVKVSESNSVNQGTVLAVDQASGNLHMAWRRFKTKSQSDAMMAARCNSTLKTCTKAVEITASMPSGFAPYTPFDQPSTSTTFRTNAMPAMAVSVDKYGTSRVHVAFSARNSLGDARVLMATSADGLNWPLAQMQQVDPGPITFDEGVLQFTRGHQLMPAMAFTEGKLMVAYYFSSFDHTVGLFRPNDPFVPDSEGDFFSHYRDPRGELLTNPALVYSSLDDALMTQRRHTLDVRLAQADVDAPGNDPFVAPYDFTRETVSHYVFGLTADPAVPFGTMADLQANPPNLPMFGGGTLAFIGDYIDVAGMMFRQQGSVWVPNDASSKSAAHYVVWADNRDVRPPADNNYALFTPLGEGGTSIFDPTQPRPACSIGRAGTRDQNVYISRINQGFALTVPQNMKPLGFSADPNMPGTLLDRAFTVLLQNFTDEARSFALSIANQPLASSIGAPCAEGRASFDQNAPLTSIFVNVPANSGTASTVFVRSTCVDASVRVTADEVVSPPATGFSAFVTLNPPGSVTALLQPDGVPSNLDIASQEVYNPLVRSPLVRSPLVRSPLVRSPLVRSPLVRSSSIADTDSTQASTLTVESFESGTSSDPNTAANTVTTDGVNEATYVLTNQGNTTSTYTIKLIGDSPGTLQLIVSQTVTTVTALGCELVVQDQNIVIANITTPPFGADPDNLGEPNVGAPGIVTVSVPPGESRLLTLRGDATLDINEVTELTAPVLVSQGTNTGDEGSAVAVPLFIKTTGLAVATVAAPYSFTLQNIGGTAPFAWSLIEGSLPAGLTFNSATGTISGTPAAVSETMLKFQVTDAADPAGLAKKTLTLTVVAAQTVTAITSDEPDPSIAGQEVAVQFTVGLVAPSVGALSGNAKLTVDGTAIELSCAFVDGAGSCPVVLTTPGVNTIRLEFEGDANYLGSSDTETHVVKGESITTITSDTPDPSLLNGPVVVSVTVTAKAPATGTPTGSVTINGGSCVVALSGGTGSCTLTFTSVGTTTITATYAGDAVFSGSSDTESHAVHYAFVGFFTPMAAAGTLSSPSVSPGSNYGSAVPLKFRLTDYNGATIADLAAISSILAVANATCSGMPSGATTLLYSPTTGATGGSTFRFDSGNQQFIFNWDTTSVPGPGCYAVLVQPSDGSQAKATYIQLK
jgi:hypothetical protein